MKALILVSLFLIGCASGPQVPVTVEIPVSKPCITKKPVRPVYKTGVGAYPGDKESAAILAADFEAAEQYGYAWELAAIGCIE